MKTYISVCVIVVVIVVISLVKRKLDVKKLKFIPVSEVPSTVQRSKWDIIFSKIPVGQALVISTAEKHPATVRAALKTLHKNGKFLNLVVTTRTVNGERVSYVLNQETESTEDSKALDTY